MPLETMDPVLLRGLSTYPALRPGLAVDSHPGVAQLLSRAGLADGNPFSPWIQPGMRVLIKPNWVRHAAEGWSELDALITHASILRPVVEFVGKALANQQGRYEGEIVIADAPLQSANFERLLSQSGLPELLAEWRSQGLPVRLRDLRRVIAETDDSTGVVMQSRPAAGDPIGDQVVDLGIQSRLEGLNIGRAQYGVSNYDVNTTSEHHQPGIHRYRIANSLLKSDVVINLPKWKTHVKTGLTGAMKNFIGVNCDKAYLPHFRPGSPREGGDEYPDSRAGVWLARLRPWIERVMPGGLLRSARRTMMASNQRSASPLVFGGAWPGNDTLWRTIHDMVWIAKWLGADGQRRVTARPILTILDAVVAGQGDGPLRPEPAAMGCLLFGLDPGRVDLAAAALSGFDWRAIPVLAHLEDAEAVEITRFDCQYSLPEVEMPMKPPSTWAQVLVPKEEVHVAA
jgi:uncharacterized protein (DUF362 family)